MTTPDWAKLEKIARTLHTGGLKATAGQIAGHLLREAIAGLPASPQPYRTPATALALGIAEPRGPGPRARPASSTVLPRTTTYLVGAGINRDVLGPERQPLPVGRDFFRYVLEQPRFSSDHARTQLTPLWEFIGRYWHQERDALRRGELDLEECFAFVELQRREAHAAGDIARLRSASQLEFLLGGLLAESFAQVDHWHFFAPPYRELGRRIYEERAAVLTFNYDTLLETAIQRGSPVIAGATSVLRARDSEGQIPDDAPAPRAWDPLLAYKVHFDELALKSGSSLPVGGDRYYAPLATREAAHPPFLKLHGSVDWYFRSGYGMDGTNIAPHPVASRSLFQRAHARFDSPTMTQDGAEVFLPLMTTAFIDKPQESHPIVRAVWKEARATLERTKTLVVLGYSFPATDFHIRHLLREIFADNSLERLYVVNPDAGVASIARDLCHYRKPVSVCRDIGEYLTGS